MKTSKSFYLTFREVHVKAMAESLSDRLLGSTEQVSHIHMHLKVFNGIKPIILIRRR